MSSGLIKLNCYKDPMSFLFYKSLIEVDAYAIYRYVICQQAKIYIFVRVNKKHMHFNYSKSVFKHFILSIMGYML